MAYLGFDEEEVYLILEIAHSELWGDLCFSGHEYLLRSGGMIRHLLGLKMDTTTKLVRFGIWARGERQLRGRKASEPYAELIDYWVGNLSLQMDIFS